MKVWVIMANDFPDSVVDSEELADRVVKQAMDAQKCNCGSDSGFRDHHKEGCPRRTNGMVMIHYRHYDFEVQS